MSTQYILDKDFEIFFLIQQYIKILSRKNRYRILIEYILLSSSNKYKLSLNFINIA